ncbi:MAG TPA: bifunctional 5,10-methylenetetrahydrofolate dehydrogenase/5,10-methenyltetrahydrofolate cyclohydrolase [Candidatus Paceibacterota bacterium]
MIIDGKKLATDVLARIREEVAELPRAPKLRVVMAGTHPAIESFVRIKERRAQEAGIEFAVQHFPDDVSTDVLVAAVKEGDEDALIVQLPLPAHVDTDAVLAAIPLEKDADVLSPEAYTRFEVNTPGALVPPVVFAVREVLATHAVSLPGTRAVVVGRGRLVGKPVAEWLLHEGAQVEVVTRSSGNLTAALRAADIIVSGAGVPKLITPELIQSGVVLIDAGTSESSGVIVGDIDPACAEKAALLTPVPGGIGPLTVVGLLANTLALAWRVQHHA